MQDLKVPLEHKEQQEHKAHKAHKGYKALKVFKVTQERKALKVLKEQQGQEQGIQGNTGTQGTEGNFGGATFHYQFSTDVDPANDTGTCNLNFNNSNIQSAGIINIDDSDDNGDDIQYFLRTIDDSTSTIKGHFRISNKTDASDFAIFTISSIVEETGIFKVNCSYVSGPTSHLLTQNN